MKYLYLSPRFLAKRKCLFLHVLQLTLGHLRRTCVFYDARCAERHYGENKDCGKRVRCRTAQFYRCCCCNNKGEECTIFYQYKHTQSHKVWERQPSTSSAPPCAVHLLRKGATGEERMRRESQIRAFCFRPRYHLILPAAARIYALLGN